MKFAEYLRCDGCGKMIPDEPYVTEDKQYCSRTCYDFIQWYLKRKALYLEQKGDDRPQT